MANLIIHLSLRSVMILTKFSFLQHSIISAFYTNYDNLLLFLTINKTYKLPLECFQFFQRCILLQLYMSPSVIYTLVNPYFGMCLILFPYQHDYVNKVRSVPCLNMLTHSLSSSDITNVNLKFIILDFNIP